MSRKKNSGFGKVLEFIGLVDDGDARDTYVDEYSSDNYGRQQPYVPQRSRVPERPRQEMTRRYPAPSYEPTRTPRMNRTAPAAPSRFDSRGSMGNPQQRRSGAYMEQSNNRAGRYDYSPRTSRFGSIDDNNAYSANSFENQEPVQRPQRSSNTSRQRTVMFTLHALEDCCDVIDNLILNNTVVLTLDNLDVKLMQRAIDTLSGAVFALHATIRKASEHTYLIAPNSVEVNETYDVDRGF